MKEFWRKNKWALIFVIPGIIGGFMYWKFIGCNSGSCPITSVWYNSSIYGAIMGFVVGSFIDDSLKKKRLDSSEESANNN